MPQRGSLEWKRGKDLTEEDHSINPYNQMYKIEDTGN